MNEPALDSYIATIDPTFAPVATRLHRAIVAGCAELDSKISYRMLTYTLDGDFRRWICAIDVHKKPFHLRLLYGALLDDPRHLLRGGTSRLANLDFASEQEIDPQLVTNYVKDAVSRYDEFKAALGEG